MDGLGYDNRDKVWKGVCGEVIKCDVGQSWTLGEVLRHVEVCEECKDRQVMFNKTHVENAVRQREKRNVRYKEA